MSEDLIERIAARLANNRANRRGAPDISNVLDILPAHLREEVMQDARDAFEIMRNQFNAGSNRKGD